MEQQRLVTQARVVACGDGCEFTCNEWYCNDTGWGVRQSSVATVVRVSSSARRDGGKDRLPGAMLKAQQVIR
jgi:hypothetical protein